MTHVFISYAHENGSFVTNHLVPKLEQAGLTAWKDSEKLRAGKDWGSEIDTAIREAFALIVVITPEAKNSEYVTYEWAFATGARIPVIPVVVKHTKLHARIEDIHHLDFTDYFGQMPWEHLIQRLQELEKEYTDRILTVPADAPYEVKQAISVLQSSNRSERQDAVQSVAKVDHPIARELLIKLLQHPTRDDVRVEAAAALGNIKHIQAIPILVSTLNNDESRDVRQTVAEALGRMGIVDAVPHLIETLQHDSDDFVRQAAAEALGKIGHTSAIPALLNVLQSDDIFVQDAAVQALAKLGETAIPGLVEAMLENRTFFYGSGAMKNIAETAVPHLINALSKTEARRSAAAVALRQLEKPAIPSLVSALSDSNPNVRRSAAEILQDIGDETTATDLLKAFHDKNIEVRCAIITAIGTIGSPIAVPEIKELLGDTRRSVLVGERICDIAARALYSIGTEDAIEAVETWWESEQGSQ